MTVTAQTKVRVAVAEEGNGLSPRLGRAVKFALFDAKNGEVRGPFYRVRHDNPGDACEGHGELSLLLRDCQAVIAGSVGARMEQRLRSDGIEVVATDERMPSVQLVARHLLGTLTRIPSSCSAGSVP
jgi:predicted Fe-Mo cluster-binding NifX family protein